MIISVCSSFSVRYASQEDALSIDDLKHFLEIEQGIAEVTREACLDIVNECEPSTQLRHKEMLGKTVYTMRSIVTLFFKELTALPDISLVIDVHYSTKKKDYLHKVRL